MYYLADRTDWIDIPQAPDGTQLYKSVDSENAGDSGAVWHVPAPPRVIV